MLNVYNVNGIFQIKLKCGCTVTMYYGYKFESVPDEREFTNYEVNEFIPCQKHKNIKVDNIDYVKLGETALYVATEDFLKEISSVLKECKPIELKATLDNFITTEPYTYSLNDIYTALEVAATSSNTDMLKQVYKLHKHRPQIIEKLVNNAYCPIEIKKYLL